MNERGELIPTRRTLLERLKDCEDQDSWKQFFDTYWRLIYTTAVKAGLTDAEAEDVVQETVISVARNIPKFNYDPAIGSFKTWLMNMTRWRIADQLRKRRPGAEVHRRPGDSTRTATVERVADPATIQRDWDRQWEENLLEVATDHTRQRVDPKQFQIFDLYARQGSPARKVAGMLGVSVARVYLAKHRIGQLIRKEVARLQQLAP